MKKTTVEELFVIIMLGSLVLGALWYFDVPTKPKPKPMLMSIDYTLLAIANTLFWECRGEPLECKRLVATTIWLDADCGDANRYLGVCLDSDRYRSWKEHDMTISRLCSPVRSSDPEYPAWQDCLGIAREMRMGIFRPIGIYETDENDVTNGAVLYPTFFHARDGKHRDWPPKKALKLTFGKQVYYFQKVEK
jgi:hypothetical protein